MKEPEKLLAGIWFHKKRLALRVGSIFLSKYKLIKMLKKYLEKLVAAKLLRAPQISQALQSLPGWEFVNPLHFRLTEN